MGAQCSPRVGCAEETARRSLSGDESPLQDLSDCFCPECVGVVSTSPLKRSVHRAASSVGDMSEVATSLGAVPTSAQSSEPTIETNSFSMVDFASATVEPRISFAVSGEIRQPSELRFFDAVSTAASEAELYDARVDSDCVTSSECGSESSGLSTASAQICHRGSMSFCELLPYLAVQNPDDINNVYTFSKDLLALADKGAMGTTWKASVKVTGAVRTVKFIPKSFTPERMASVRKLIDITATFDHPNLVRLHEIFENQEFAQLVLEYCPGGNLQNRLKQGAFSEAKGVIVMQQVFRAVSYLHIKKICHRDVQPQNILFLDAMKEIDNSCLIKVTGFSTLCKITLKKKFTKQVGHSAYLAPEVFRGRYGMQCDLWSCGVVLFEMLCGRMPFPEEEELNDMTEVQFSRHDEHVSHAARELMTLLLTVTPRARYDINQVLHHRWLANALPELSSVPFDASTLAHLKAFRLQSKFQQAALRIVVGLLAHHEIADCHNLFLFLDADGDGKLMPSELESIIASDPQLSQLNPDICEIFRYIDHNDTCTQQDFTYTEFVAATFNKEKCLTEEVCRVAFRCFDKDGDGVISLSELAHGHLLDDLSLEELGKTFRDLDRNRDQKIDFREFTNALRNVRK